MERILARLIFILVGLMLLAVLAGCETTKVETPAPPGAAPEPSQPIVTEQKAEPALAPPPPMPSPKVEITEEPYFVHTVRWRGESLLAIAAWYTGTTRNARILAEVNSQVTKPKRIPVGDKVRIPVKMLRTREMIPKGFVESYMSPPNQSRAGDQQQER
ncbi:MAG TPA: hypothetical protein VMT71_08600 [Syntrophorhabdales bacterium]|nr:hypothetical protein [Syntrophorhabdales bacterium]